MATLLQLQNSIAVMRRELQNLRKQVDSLKHMLKNGIMSVKHSLSSYTQHTGLEVCATSSISPPKKSSSKENISRLISTLSRAAIGTMRTCFREKNGTPRQPGLCPSATGSIRIEEAFTNPDHSLEGLEDYSHAWLLFVFHLNKQNSVKAKVKPPRLGGQKRGVFATRSPHRPCPVGLSLVRIDEVVGDTVHVSGVDLVDGTPILDIKPYIPTYDRPIMHLDGAHTNVLDEGYKGEEIGSSVRVAPWLESPPVAHLEVEFTQEAEHQLSLFQCQCQSSTSHRDTGPPTQDTQTQNPTVGTSSSGVDDSMQKGSPYILQTFTSLCEARQAIVDVLQQDPRSVYRRNKCSREVYKFSIDNLNITSQCGGGKAVVIDIQPKELWTYNHTAGIT